MIVQSLVLRKILENDIQQEYSYKLISTLYNDIEAYGIEIDRVDSKEGEILKREYDSVELISPCKAKVQDLIDKLYKYEVSPIHLIDVIGEYVDKCVSDFDKIQ